MNTGPITITCPHCSHERLRPAKFPHPPSSFGYGLDFRLIPADSNLSSQIAICPECLYVSWLREYREPSDPEILGNIKDLISSAQYKGIFRGLVGG